VDRIFVNRSKTFWLFQAMGWSGYVLLRMFNGAINQQELVGYFFWVLVGAAAGLVLTSLLRYIYRAVRTQRMAVVLFFAVVMSTLLGMVISAVELMALPVLVPGSEPFQGLDRLANAMFETTALLAWTAIYFGYHYYESFQEEKERAIQAVAQAHQAQLKMLRYQLNPHFLFNTLNAISTLVLEQASEEANHMLTKLSAFLRYTLVNQPSQKVTIEQELYTLQLYLDIEKVRFQDRLCVELDVDDTIRDALVPSLILQPLIENAIKYAIAPSENGGTLAIEAKPSGDGKTLALSLQDSGPGIPDLHDIKSQSGSGVGIVNTRQRLQQLYGSGHRIILENLQPHGLGVHIIIPIQRDEKTKSSAARR